MTEKKLDYLSPETEALILKIEGAILEASVTGTSINDLYNDEDPISF